MTKGRFVKRVKCPLSVGTGNPACDTYKEKTRCNDCPIKADGTIDKRRKVAKTTVDAPRTCKHTFENGLCSKCKCPMTNEDTDKAILETMYQEEF